ncbi:MAG: hypothetical protein ACK421_12430 [Pseudanabaenaceae cyanobacterium]
MWQYKFLLSRSSPEGGFNLVEALVAVIVVGILATATLPLFLMSIGSRAQARRVDLASQAGRSYIDAVRSGALTVADLPNSGPNRLVTLYSSPGVPIKDFDTIPAPDPANYLASTSGLRGIRIDGNTNGFSEGDSYDFVIQPMRTRIVPIPPATDEPASLADRETALRKQGFTIGIRVYRADAFSLPRLYRGSEPACQRGRTVFGRGLGNRACPVVTMWAHIVSDVNSATVPESFR